MRRLLATFTSFLLLLLVLAPAALADERRPRLLRRHERQGRDRRRLHPDHLLPDFVFAMSMLQRRLDKRKDARKAAQKSHVGNAQWRGGW